MRRRRCLRCIGSASTIAIASLAGCSGPEGETEPEGGADETTTQQGATESEGGADGTTSQRDSNEVAMLTEDSDFIFDPIGLHVEPGETITWINESGSHSSTAYTEDNPQSEVRRIPEDADGWNSDTLSEQGAEFTHTFEVEGTYDYYCIPHKSTGMVARLVVGEPSGIEGDPPDGPVPSEQTIVDEGVVTQEEFNP